MTDKRWMILIGGGLISGTLATYLWLGNYALLADQKTEQAKQSMTPKTASEISQTRIEALQEKLYQDKQNGQLWYQLGHAYLLNGEYENALTVFDYAIRLSKHLTSDHYASKAVALYHLNKQHITEEVDGLMNLALSMDKNNQTVLMMRANEQFMQARYQGAINLWVQILDSQQVDIDRVGIIQRINQAKQFMK